MISTASYENLKTINWNMSFGKLLIYLDTNVEFLQWWWRMRDT
jgi:hypothetical protein